LHGKKVYYFRGRGSQTKTYAQENREKEVVDKDRDDLHVKLSKGLIVLNRE